MGFGVATKFSIFKDKIFDHKQETQHNWPSYTMNQTQIDKVNEHRH